MYLGNRWNVAQQLEGLPSLVSVCSCEYLIRLKSAGVYRPLNTYKQPTPIILPYYVGRLQTRNALVNIILQSANPRIATI